MPGIVRILSAGAPKRGVGSCARVFARKTGAEIGLEFATAPALRERVGQGNPGADILVAPSPHMDEYAARSIVAKDTLIPIGAVRAGVAVRAGADIPDISSVESLRQALLAADAVLYNMASSGQFIAQMIETLGLKEALAARTELFPTGAAVMVRLAEGKAPRELGFGQVTEIKRFADGIRLVGPLPEAAAKVTHYTAGLLAGAPNEDDARALLQFMGSAEAHRIYAESGLE